MSHEQNGSQEFQPSLFSDKRIFEELKSGRIVIDPFTPELVNTSSVDVRLGEWYYRPKKDHGLKFYNPWSKKHVDLVYGQPQQAKLATEEFGEDLPDGIKPTDRVIIAYPDHQILCHTIEFIGARQEITTMMHARSGVGRSDITVCRCAGWGDVGFISRWTMEVTAHGFGLDLPEILIVGEPVAQIEFIEVGQTVKPVYGISGNYQDSTDLEEIKSRWSQNQMLPRLWKSRTK